jgi:hypothetical protein
MIPFYHHRLPDWDRAKRLAAQLEYERDVRDRERTTEAVDPTWSVAQHVRKEAA